MVCVCVCSLATTNSQFVSNQTYIIFDSVKGVIHNSDRRIANWFPSITFLTPLERCTDQIFGWESARFIAHENAWSSKLEIISRLLSVSQLMKHKNWNNFCRSLLHCMPIIEFKFVLQLKPTQIINLFVWLALSTVCQWKSIVLGLVETRICSTNWIGCFYIIVYDRRCSE